MITSSDPIRDWYDWILLSFTGASNIVQLFVLWLIVVKSPEIIKDYRFFIFGTTASDLLFSATLGFGIEPHFWIPHSMGLHAYGLVRLVGHNGGRIGYGMAATALCAQLNFQMFAMFYRYCNLMSWKYSWLPNINGWRPKAAMLLFVLASSGLIGFVSFKSLQEEQAILAWHFNGYLKASYFEDLCQQEDFKSDCIDGHYHTWNTSLLNNSAAMNELLAEPLLSRAIVRIEGIRMELEDGRIIEASSAQIRERVVDEIRFQNYTPEMEWILGAIKFGYPIIYMDFLSPVTTLTCTVYMLALIFLQIIALIQGFSIIGYLRTNANSFSAQTYRMQMQLIVLLIIQLIEPVLLLIVPIFFVLGAVLELKLTGQNQLLRIENPRIEELGVLILSGYSLLNPALIVYFVAPYRQFIATKFRTIFFCYRDSGLYRGRVREEQRGGRQHQPREIVGRPMPPAEPSRESNNNLTTMDRIAAAARMMERRRRGRISPF